MTDRQAKAAAKRARRAARPQGGGGPKTTKPEPSHYPWLGPRKVYALPMAANSAALAAASALCTGAPSAPPRPSPPPGKNRR